MKVIMATKAAERSLSYQLRFRVMCKELGWLPVDSYPEGEEKDEYDEEQSMIFVAVDDENNIIGTSRLIFEGNIKLPIEKNFKLYPWNFIETLSGRIVKSAEISRFIVPYHPTIKNHVITLMLCKAMFKMSIANRLSHILISADHRFYRLIKILGFNFIEIGEPGFYMGSKTVPAILPMNNLTEKWSLKEFLVNEDDIFEPAYA